MRLLRSPPNRRVARNDKKKTMADELQSNNDEILVMDETGQFKILSGGQLKSFDSFSDSAAAGTALENDEEENLQPILPIDTGYEEPMLQPPPPALYKQTSSFYFHPADEEEAAKHQSGHSDSAGRKKYSLDKIVVKVAENYQLDQNGELFSRLRSAIFNFLRDRRSAVDTKDMLLRPSASGGLNLKAELSDNLLEFLKKIKQKIEGQAGVVVDEKEEAGVQSMSGQFKKTTIVQPQEIKLPVPPKPIATVPAVSKFELPKNAPLIPVSEPAPVVQTASIRTPLPDLPQVKAKTAMPGMAKFQRPLKEGAPRLTDVKKDYKLVGPVDELSLLTLETFRRLGVTAAERSQKIAAKINLLAKDSLSKKALGLNAWRQSPLYKMYLALGRASMEHGLDLDAVIKEYTGQGKEILTLEEFNAITDINKQLRF